MAAETFSPENESSLRNAELVRAKRGGAALLAMHSLRPLARFSTHLPLPLPRRRSAGERERERELERRLDL